MWSNVHVKERWLNKTVNGSNLHPLVIFQANLSWLVGSRFSFSLFWEEPVGASSIGFDGLDGLPVTQQTVSKH